MGKVPLQVIKEFEHQARENLYTLKFSSTFTETTSECNTNTVKRIKSQIQKGANPEEAPRHGYEKTCDYLDILNRMILIQHRALACLSKALAHIVQWQLYTIGNSSLIRCEAEMTHLQLQLDDSRHQELRISPFWHTPLFNLYWLRIKKSSSIKKAPLKTLWFWNLSKQALLWPPQ